MTESLSLFGSAEMELVELPTLLYDDWIRDHFPDFQRRNRADSSSNVRISFAHCEWVSPLPILAIATELMSFSGAGRSVEIDLGEGASSDEGAKRRWRTLKYLSFHGFLSAFVSREDILVRFQFDTTGEKGREGQWYEGAAGLKAVRETIDRSRVELIYGDSIVLPVTIWRLPSSNAINLTATVRAKVRELLKQADTSLFRFKTESRKYRDVTLQRLNQILLELVENAAEHAYVESMSGFVGLYARVRHTKSEEAIGERKREISKSPLLGKVLLNEKQQQIELFILDVGRGLCADLENWKSEELRALEGGKSLAQPLRQTASLLFLRPLSRHDRAEKEVARLRGSSTGLMHLNKILSHGEGNDRTRIVTGTEWLAGPHPRPSGFHDNVISTEGHKQNPESIAGTFYHLGISPAVIPELNTQWFSSDKATSADTRRSVISKFVATKPPRQLVSNVIDIRNGEGIESVQSRVANKSATTLGATVVRVNRVAEKNLVNMIVVSWLLGTAKSKRKSSLLFLCDLGRYQAVDTVWVVEQLFSGKERYDLSGWIGEASIFLITEDLCCTELRLTFKARRDGLTQLSVGRATADISKLDNRLVFLLEELRVCDSVAMWARVHALSGTTTPNPILLKDVLWPSSGANVVLPYYLNFSPLIQDEDAARCIRRSLRRVLALFPQANHHALDTLVGTSLHDAKKWLIPPPKDSVEMVLVGSLSVSGSTLSRFRKPPKTSLTAVVDSIRTPYFSNSSRSGSTPHLAALLWDSSLETTTSNTPSYRRVGRSAYVEEILPVPAPVKYDEGLYLEIESARLIKVGHWAHGDRHSLLELNAEIAIDQSGASESGAIPFLVDELTALCKTNRVVLAFPVDKLAYRLAHHVKFRLNTTEVNAGGGLTLLPLSFMPRFAGGLTRFAPLVAKAARISAQETNAKKPIAVFLDFGFITNRTVRHAVRQLAEAGFEDIRAMGLLNRSSAPDLPSESLQKAPISKTFPRTYWRWNVPVLGTGTHCPLCGALPALGRLSRIVDDSHADLVLPLRELGEAWKAREITDFWEEYGLTPLPLADAVRDAIAPLAEQISSVPAYSSSTLAARAIEYLRTTGDAETPLRLAQALLDAESVDHATELLCVLLLLAGGSFAPTDRDDYVSLLGTACVFLSDTRLVSVSEMARRNCLIGLVTIVFTVQPVACKLAVLNELVLQLEKLDVTDSPTVRLALLALTTDADVSTSVQIEFERLCTQNRTKMVLLGNYHSLRPNKSTIPETWYMLAKAFGRSSSHSQQSELGYLKSQLSRTFNVFNSLPHLNRLASLLAQCDQRFVEDTIGQRTNDILFAVQKLKILALSGEIAVGAYLIEIEKTFSVFADGLHSTLVRYGDKADSPLVHNVFLEMIQKQVTANGLTLLKDVVLTRTALTLRWPSGIGDYFPLGEQVGRLFGEVFANIFGKSAFLAPPETYGEFLGLAEKAKAWIWFDQSCEEISSGVSVVIVTGLTSNKSVPQYKPKVTRLDDFGVRVTSRMLKVHYFEIRIRIPSLGSILEMK